MKIVKMLCSREIDGKTLVGDVNYKLDDRVADELITDGRAELIAVVPEPEKAKVEESVEVETAEAEKAPETTEGAGNRRKRR